MKTIWNVNTLPNSKYIASGKGKTVNSLFPEVGIGGGMNKQSTGFLGQRKYDSIIKDICYYAFVQAHRMCDTKNKS